jgi:Ca-activated chloride channel family protein
MRATIARMANLFSIEATWNFRRLRSLLAAVVLAATAHAADQADPAAPHFLVSGGAAGVDALPLKSTRVEATLAGIIGEVRVTQTYANEGTVPLEARYVFPGSTRAAVHALTMTIGSRRIEAQIKEKSEARRTYDEAKASGRTASLLESQRSNIFEMNVANILPGDQVTVELRYTELLVQTDGEYEWVFPTVVGPRYVSSTANHDATGTTAESPSANATIAGGDPLTEPVFTLAADIVAGVPVQDVHCATHPIETATGSDGRVRIQISASDTPAMNRDFILRFRLAGEQLGGGLLLDEWGGEKFFLLTLQPPRRIERSAIPPRDYVFVIDVSGSMNGFPLNTAKSVIRELLVGLREEDTFNVILFSGASERLSPEPLSATPQNIAAAIGLIEGRNGGGGTELLPALQDALSLPRRPGIARSIAVMTDGYVDVEAEAYALVRARLNEANLFAFGIGSSVNRELIERLARAGKSEPIVVERESDAPKAATAFRAMVESPILTQVRTQFGGITVADVSPASVPDVLAQRPVVIVGRWSGAIASDAAASVSGFTAEGEWREKIAMRDAIDLGSSGLLAQLWARERLAGLEDLNATGNDRVHWKNEIVQLGLRYNLLTRFTSFVAVDATPRNAAAPTQSVTQPTALPEGMAIAEAADAIPTTPEPETSALVLAAGAAVAWIFWRRRRRPARSATAENTP